MKYNYLVFMLFAVKLQVIQILQKQSICREYFFLNSGEVKEYTKI